MLPAPSGLVISNRAAMRMPGIRATIPVSREAGGLYRSRTAGTARHGSTGARAGAVPTGAEMQLHAQKRGDSTSSRTLSCKSSSAHVMQWLNAVGHDIRNGGRLLRKSPVLSLATVATLALGIGLDTGVFTLLDGMMFRARVNDDPPTFVQISVEDARPSAPPATGLPFTSLQDYRAYRDGVRSIRDIAAWTPVAASLGAMATGDGEASSRIMPMLVTCNFFDVYDRTRPLAGRTFDRRDCEAPSGALVAVMAE